MTAEGGAWRPCVGVLLLGPGGVFAGRRADRPEAAWQMPQGGVDPGEDLRAAALRELREETGIAPHLVAVEALGEPVRYEVPEPSRPARWGGRWRGQEITWVRARFLGSDADVRLDADKHPEFSAWRWADPKELLAGIVPWKRPAYEAALRLL